MKKFLGLVFLLFLFAGCGGSYHVKESASAANYRVTTAYVVNQGGKSTDMDNHVVRALMSKGLKVSSGLSEQKNPLPDLLVKYSDGWQWDLLMYLSKVEITFYDKSGNILVTGGYENSFWHEWPNPAETVQRVIDDMFAKMSSVQFPQRKKP